MKKALVVILILLLGLGGTALPAASADETVVSLSEANDGDTVALRGDQILVIDLEGNLSTGYLWEVAAVDDAILLQVGQFEFRQYSDVVGSAGRQTLRFRAAGEGRTGLVLAYRRPWEDAAPLRTFSVSVQTAGPITPIEEPDAGPPPAPPAKDLGPISTADLPAEHNWCALGGCTPVKNQGNCGSCWAFATVGVVESLIRIGDGVERDLSEQYLVSCNTHGWSCDGGGRAFAYFIDRIPPGEPDAGAVYESEYPYTSGSTGSAGACTGQPHNHYEKLVSWNQSSSLVAAIKQAIYDYGPVYVSVCAGPAFSSYSGGVFSTHETDYCLTHYGSPTNHGVVLVGWDDTQGTSGVWYLRNSWGTGWGESLAGAPAGKGYMRVEYGTSNVGRWPTYAIYRQDVGITKGVVGSDFAPGDPITFTLSIENNGSAVAAGVVVTDVIPAEVLTPTFASTLAITPTGVVSYVWEVEPLLAGESGTITIYGWIDPGLPSDFAFVNWATISDPEDNFINNNTSSVTVGGREVYLPLVMKD
jgi:inhibitor of cysteine peptidase